MNNMRVGIVLLTFIILYRMIAYSATKLGHLFLFTSLFICMQRITVAFTGGVSYSVGGEAAPPTLVSDTLTSWLATKFR